MSITLDQNKMLIQMIKEFTANELAPLDMEIDQRGDYTDGLFQKVVDTGLLGMTLPGSLAVPALTTLPQPRHLNIWLPETPVWLLPWKVISKRSNSLSSMGIKHLMMPTSPVQQTDFCFFDDRTVWRLQPQRNLNPGHQAG